MNEYIRRIFLLIVVAGVVIYLVKEIPDILSATGDVARDSGILKTSAMANTSKYFNNFSNVGKKYYEK